MCGSDAKFGGRTNLFKQHGDYEIYDVYTTIERGRRKYEDWVWWGFEDQNLFQYAKEELTRIGSQDQPFNFTFLTCDTHFPKGHPCSECEKKEGDEFTYDDVMRCSSRQIKLFVDWCKDQPWYENTTIILVGDHLTMDVDMSERMEKGGYKRGIYNCIINGAIDIPEEETKNKPFTTFDLFPTTLAAMGYTIEGNRLALGTNLYSDEKTLLEKHSLDYINGELAKVSKFYNKNILYSK
jgi:phosphoglycerol transferase